MMPPRATIAIEMAISTALVPQPAHALLAAEVEPRDYFEARKKWGNESIDAGFQILPDTLLRCQRFCGVGVD
jgi:hypothetical protein